MLYKLSENTNSLQIIVNKLYLRQVFALIKLAPVMKNLYSFLF